jgi:hypothetical protein
MILNIPPKEIRGLALLEVKGARRFPWPPARMKVSVEKSIPVVECMRKFLYVRHDKRHVKYREIFGVNLEDCGRGSGRSESSGIHFKTYRYRPNRRCAIFAKHE